MQNISTTHIQKLKNHLWVKSEKNEHEKSLWKKVEKFLKLFNSLPWIQCICVCNSLAMNATNKDSDIDLFIISKTNRLWTARIMMTLSMILTWQRKNKYNHAWKFCLSFFISEQNLDISEIALENDVYLAYWIQTLVPIINKNETFEKFQKANSYQNIITPEKSDNSRITHLQSELKWVRVWNFIEKIFKSIFLPRTKKRFSQLWKPYWVIITDTMLKFHNEDKRIIIRDQILQDSV